MAECGTTTKYHAGCRCDICVPSWRAYLAAYRKRPTGGEDGLCMCGCGEPPRTPGAKYLRGHWAKTNPPAHGSKRMYQIYGCRCPECRAEHARLAREFQLRRRGFDPAAVDQILADQYHACAICFTPFGDDTPAADHAHDTNTARGFLCPRCNMALGGFWDHPNLLRRAARYIEIWKAN